MNLHLPQITSFPFRSGAARPFGQHGGSRNDAAGIFGVDINRPAVGRALRQKIARLLAWLNDMPRRSHQQADLAQLTERDLSDIGLTSGDLGRLHDPAFAADRAMGRLARNILMWL